MSEEKISKITKSVIENHSYLVEDNIEGDYYQCIFCGCSGAVIECPLIPMPEQELQKAKKSIHHKKDCIIFDAMELSKSSNCASLNDLKESIDKKLIFYKMFMDRDSLDSTYCVLEHKEMESQLESFLDGINGEEFPPIFEPVLMTQHEFQNLPDFDGF